MENLSFHHAVRSNPILSRLKPVSRGIAYTLLCGRRLHMAIPVVCRRISQGTRSWAGHCGGSRARERGCTTFIVCCRKHGTPPPCRCGRVTSRGGRGGGRAARSARGSSSGWTWKRKRPPPPRAPPSARPLTLPPTTWSASWRRAAPQHTLHCKYHDVRAWMLFLEPNQAVYADMRALLTVAWLCAGLCFA